MATSLVINGVSYPYPDTADQSWGTAASAWAAAVTTGMLQKAGGTFALTADVNFGTNFGVLSKYFTSQTSNSAASGVVRLANADGIGFRNVGNTADILLQPDADGILKYNSIDLVNLSATQTLTNKTITGTFVGNLTGNITGTAASVTGTAANVTGVVALVNGGTGLAAASANAAFNALSPMTTGGDLIYGGASGAATRLGNGTVGQYLTSAGTTAAPTWTTSAAISALTGDVSAAGPGSVAATVNSVGGSTAANIHAAEVLANAATNLNNSSQIVKRSATGLVTIASVICAALDTWSLPYFDSANQMQDVPLGATGSVPMSTGVAAAPSFVSLFAPFFGDGSDGNLTVTTSNATSGPLTLGVLTRDACFNNLTISGSGAIQTGGFRLFVKGILDITGAGVSAINANGNAGINAASSTGSAQPTAQPNGTIAGCATGAAGQSGSTGAGSQGNSGTSSALTNGGLAAGGGGIGGTGAGGAAGAARSAGSNTGTVPIRRYEIAFLKGNTLIAAGASGCSGGSGAGDGASNSGGGSGSGGNSGGILAIYANTINRGGGTAGSAISAIGGVGGAGFTATAGNTGGGGGSGGGAGGWIYLVYAFLTGSTATNVLDASGGAGNSGGGGHGSGTGATGGSGAYGGTITIFPMQTASGTQSVGSAGTAGTAGSGTSGGPGGAGNTLQVSL